MTHRPARIRELFDAALEQPEERRVDWLREQTGDPAVISAVERLLRADADALPLLDASPEELAEMAGIEVEPATDELIGRRIGPYRVTGVLGEGGMGRVLRATREDLEIEVALKLVRGGLGDPGRIARFHMEQRLLARLNHPNVARLMDAGVAGDGTPWLAMEHVEGRTITEWAIDGERSVEERLRLFLDLCDAVDFAHRNLVVHRDLKPSNVLVTGDGVVKLLDFGVAKLLERDPSGALTETGDRILSPEYASPEQVLGDPVTTATDVHGLGLVLYELLTRRRPYAVRSSTRAQILSAVVDTRIIRPSSVVPDPPDGTTRVAASDLRGDLDAICLKALEKSPSDRYPTVGALRDDVRRFLEGLPVEARLPTLAYRAGKALRRHRVAVGVGALVAAAVIGGTTISVVQEARAVAALEEAAEVTAFLERMFEAGNPTLSGGHDIRMSTFLEQAYRSLDEIDHRPAVRARLMNTMGAAYAEIGMLDRARELAEGALALGEELGEGGQLSIASSSFVLGTVAFELAEEDRAQELFTRAFEIRRDALGPGHVETTEAMLRISEVARFQGDFDLAREMASEALRIRRETDPASESVAGAAVQLAKVLNSEQGHGWTPKELLVEALHIREELYGPEDFRVEPSLTVLGAHFAYFEPNDSAIDLIERALALRAQVYGEDRVQYAELLNNLATARMNLGQVDDARAIYRDAIAIYDREVEGDHPMKATMVNNLSNTFYGRGQFDSAEHYLRQALEMRVRLEGADDVDVALLFYNLGNLQLQIGQEEAGLANLEEAWRIRREQHGPDNPSTLRAAAVRGFALARVGRLDESEEFLREVVGRQSGPTLGSSEDRIEVNFDLLRTQAFLGAVVAEQGRYDEAEEIFGEALRTVREHQDPNGTRRREIVFRMRRMYIDWGRPEESDRLASEEADALERLRAADGAAAGGEDP